MKRICSVLLVLAHYACARHSPTGLKPFIGCETNAFPPNKSSEIPWYTINLDLPPDQRWTQLVAQKQQHMVALFDDVKNLTQSLFGNNVFNFLMNNLEKLTDTLPSPYREEIEAIAKISGQEVAEVTLYNVFYEVYTFCTSIIVQDPDGNLFHGRNLDFGLFMGWDKKEHHWRMSQLVKPLIVQLDWQRGGATVFKSVNFAGYVGIITAVKEGRFTFSLDKRFALDGGFMGLLEWILLKDYNQKWLGFLTREMMEEAESYDEARALLSHTRLLAPIYFILGGSEPGQGTIITRWRDNFRAEDLATSQHPWFLVETNYDGWEEPPFYDDRRTPATHCLRKAGHSNASLGLIYNVLSTRPVFNKLTTYTSLMEVKRGSLWTWLRDCEDPCWPW